MGSIPESSNKNNHRKFKSTPMRPESRNPSNPTTPTVGSSLRAPDPLESTNSGVGLANPSSNSNFEDTSCGYCTEEQLEGYLFRKLDSLYNEAISKILSLGYDEDIALKSILWNGHCYGSMDVMTNILHNAISYIHKTGSDDEDDDNDDDDGNSSGGKPESGFSNLRDLVLYSMEGMIRLVQQLRPDFSRGDAMWCLLMTDLHVGRASTVQIPVMPSDNGGNGGAVDHVPPGPCEIHGNWSYEGAEVPASGLAYDPAPMNLSPSLMGDFEFVKRFNLPPQLEAQLKRNVAIFAAGFRASSKAAGQLRALPQASSSSSPTNDSHLGVAAGSKEKHRGKITSQNSEVMSTIIGGLGNMTIGEKSVGTVGQKNEMSLNLDNQIAELEQQLEERKEWAFQKAMQAARKLSNDLKELKQLRMEREETLRLKKGKQALEDTTMKRLSEMENALRKASGQVDRANAAVRRLEADNAEIRAEMEASRLSASESDMACYEVAKRDKKHRKKRLALDKQKEKLLEEVAEERKKIAQLQQQLELINAAQKEAEIKWRQAQKEKELAVVQLEEERRSKEAAEASLKRTQEMRREIETKVQRYKDDIQRLEQELSRLRASAESTQPNFPSNAFGKRETNLRMLHDMHRLQELSQKEVGHGRKCLICMKDEVSVVFLPCAHEVLCVGCNGDHEREAKTKCPCCGVQIEERIHVYGATS
ncbi:hypothetical protein AAC387_Pa01g3134 [Persea americana]